MKIIESPKFDIRYSALTDETYLRIWLEEEGMLHWFPPCDKEEVENFIRIWIGFSRLGASLTAIFEEVPIAMATLYLMPYQKVAHQCMFQIIVSREKQRQGVGRSLMKNLKHLAKTYFSLEFIHGEILDDSPFVPLLQSLDFEIFARQERFMKEEGIYYPRILMECSLK